MDSSTLAVWDSPFQIEGCLVSFYIAMFIELSVFNEDSLDIDQMPHCLHCLPMSF